MAKEIYIAVDITEYGNGSMNCYLTQQVDDGELEMTKLELDHARKLMWELVLAGGKKQVRINTLNRDIVSREVYIFLPSE